MQAHHNKNHHHGLAADLATLTSQTRQRRQILGWLGAGAAFPLVGCGGGGDSGTTSTTTTSSTSSAATSVAAASTTSTDTTATSSSSSCSTIPSETAGPYPGDGTNSANGSVVNALTLSGIVRSNITTSVASASGTAAGVALTVTLKVVNTASSCASLAGFAVYLWHCDATGKYSMYDIATENYLRGVQVTNSSGEVTFTTIFPGCYSGRWPHIHFEVYSSLAAATTGNNDIKTSQLAMPLAACNSVYASSLYTGSAANLASSSLASDNVFSDGSSLQVATVTGSNTAGYVATLQLGVSV